MINSSLPVSISNRRLSLSPNGDKSLSPSKSPSFGKLDSHIVRKFEEANRPLGTDYFPEEKKEEKQIPFVQSHLYFINPLNAFLDMEGAVLREKKFKKKAKLYKDSDIEFLKLKKKGYEEKLWTLSEASLKTSLISTMITYAMGKCPFASIPPCFLSDSRASVETFQELYEKLVNKLIEIENRAYSKLSKLENFINFSEISYDAAREKLGWTDDSCEDKINQELWVEREDLTKLLADCWDGDLKNSGKNNKNIKEFFKKNYKNKEPFAEGLLSTELRPVFEKKYPGAKIDKKEITELSSDHGEMPKALKIKLTSDQALKQYQERLSQKRELKNNQSIDRCKLNNVFNPMIKLLTKELNQLIESDCKEIEKLKEEFALVCMSDHSEFFTKVSESLYETKKSCLTVLIKEQKQHSLARCCNLINYYTAFVNTIEYLSQVAKQNFGIDADKVKLFVNQILENAHLEFKGDEKKLSEIKKMITVYPELHREKYIMGFEKDPLNKNDSDLFIKLLNMFLDSHSNETGAIKKLERCHTLPFPAEFAWDKEKMLSLFNKLFEYSGRLDEKYTHPHLDEDFFKKLVKKNVNHKDIEAKFKSEFEGYTIRYKDDGMQFLYSSLKLVKGFYLYLFSETELLPDFINGKLDTLSEWRFSDNDFYKKELKKSLQSMISSKHFVTSGQVAQSLLPYFEKTMEKLLEAHANYHETDSNQTLLNLVKIVCLYQFEESMRIALNINDASHLTQELFEKNVSSLVSKKYEPEAFKLYSKNTIIDSFCIQECEEIPYNADSIANFF